MCRASLLETVTEKNLRQVWSPAAVIVHVDLSDFRLRDKPGLDRKGCSRFHSTGKRLRRPRRIDPWREGRGTRGKLLFVRIWKLPL